MRKSKREGGINFNPLGFVGLGLPSIFGGHGAAKTAAASTAVPAVTRVASHAREYRPAPPRPCTVKYRELVYVPVCADGRSGGTTSDLSWNALWRGPRWARREGCALMLLFCCLLSCVGMLMAYLLGFNSLLFNSPTTAAGQACAGDRPFLALQPWYVMRAANEYYFEYFQCLRYDAALPYVGLARFDACRNRKHTRRPETHLEASIASFAPSRYFSLLSSPLLSSPLLSLPTPASAEPDCSEHAIPIRRHLSI